MQNFMITLLICSVTMSAPAPALNAIPSAVSNITWWQVAAIVYQDAFLLKNAAVLSQKRRILQRFKKAFRSGRTNMINISPLASPIPQRTGVLRFNGQRVKFLIDRAADEGAYALWADDAGTANLAVIRDALGRITGVESISDEKAQEYQAAADEYAQISGDRRIYKSTPWADKTLTGK